MKLGEFTETQIMALARKAYESSFKRARRLAVQKKLFYKKLIDLISADLTYEVLMDN